MATQEPPHEIRNIHIEGLALVGVKEHCEGTRNIRKAAGVHQRSGKTTGSDGRVVGGGCKTNSPGFAGVASGAKLTSVVQGLKFGSVFLLPRGRLLASTFPLL